MSILLTILAFNFIIIVHELGHFIAAKASVIKVLEFSLFVGPKIFSITRGETVYSLRLFPVLAYVKMEGEDEESDSTNSFSKKPLYIRAIVIFAGPFANLLTAFIMLVIVFSMTGYSTTKVHQVEINSPAAKSDILPGDSVVRYSDLKTYTPLNIIEYLYVSKGQTESIDVSRDGQLINKKITPQIIPANRYLIGFSPVQTYGADSTIVEEVTPGSPADKAGLQNGDKIVKIDSTPVMSMTDVITFISTSKQTPIDITVLRNGQQVVLNDIVPIQSENPESYDLGIEFEYLQGNVLGASKYSTVFTYSTIKNVGYTIVWLIQGKVSLSQMVGPVGIATTINTAAEQGTTSGEKVLSLLRMTAFISIAIGATNLIPFPALDGSKLLLIAIEAIRRKPIPPEKEATITMIGFVLLLVLVIFTTANDFIRIFTK